MGGREIDLGSSDSALRESSQAIGNTSLTEGEIRAQVERILGSVEFRVPDRTRKFLRYVVDECLAGHANRIKAYSIAIEVFGRNESFDAQQDPVVRTEAGRLRQALERYYLVAGQTDPIIVSIPKGGYVPVFEPRLVVLEPKVDSPERPLDVPTSPRRRKLTGSLLAVAIALIAVLAAWIAALEFSRARTIAADDAAAQNSSVPAALLKNLAPPYAPRIRVDPFTSAADTRQSQDIGTGLAAEIINQLSKFKNLVVVSGYFPPARTTDAPRPDYLITGNIQVADEKIQIWVQLLDGKDGAILWSRLYDQALSVDNLMTMQMDVAKNVSVTLGQPTGMVMRSATTLEQGSRDDIRAYTCVLSYYNYRVDLDPSRHAEVRACLEQTVARVPDYARAWALLSLIYMDEERFEYNPKDDAASPILRALEAAERAVKMDPQNATALYALMSTRFLSQDVAGGKEAGERALALNPNDIDVLAEYGNRLALAGERKRGMDMIERAMLHESSPSNVFYPMLAGAYYFDRDLAKAAAAMDKTWVKRNPIVLMTAVAIYARVGRMDDADRARREFLALGSRQLEDLEHAMSKRNLSESDKAYFVEGLVKGGLPVPAAIVARYAGKA